MSSIEERLREKKEESGRPTLSEDQLREIVQQGLQENPNAVADYQSGNKNSIQFLLGQVMQKSRGQAAPKASQKLIQDEIDQ